MGWVLLAIVLILAILVGWAIGMFNRLVRLRNQVNNSWSQIDVQLQRRYDLIPNLVETVKGYMQYEKSTLEAVIEARNRAQSARELLEKKGGPTAKGASLEELIGAETSLSGALGKIFALAERYPELRAVETMQRLQEQLASTENKVAFARQAYNDTAMLYNMTQQQFPTLLVASLFGHHPSDLYEVTEEKARKGIKVQF
ncbi:MAG: LemA family protein [Chlamydiales bacterium]